MSIYGNDLLLQFWAQQQSGPHVPTDGLVFWASLDGQTPDVAETGQTLTNSGTYSFAVVDGIPCCTSEFGKWHATFTATGFPSGAADKTISFWAKILSTSRVQPMFGYGNSQASYQRSVLYVRYDPADESTNVLQYNTNIKNITLPFVPTLDRWHCFAIAIADKSASLYCDAVLVGTGSLPRMNSVAANGVINQYTSTNYGGCPMAACRIYNRALSAAEIQALASEFRPVYAS